MDKLIIKNLKYLNDSVLSILFLMPVTLIIIFEVLDNDPSLKYLSFATSAVYILGIWYTAYRLYTLHQILLQEIESAESNSSSSE
ncbi:MAG: sodium:proton antiporter [Methanosarcinales archaeon]|nr:sodium:proton antiporter [Methanosarcinales archaeon]